MGYKNILCGRLERCLSSQEYYLLFQRTQGQLLAARKIAHNYLWLQLQEIQCFSLASKGASGTHTILIHKYNHAHEINK